MGGEGITLTLILSLKGEEMELEGGGRKRGLDSGFRRNDEGGRRGEGEDGFPPARE